MHISLRNKTILGIAVIEAALLILLIFTAVNFMRNTLSDDLVKRASTVATLFATAAKSSVLSYDLATLEAYCAELMKNPDMAYIKVLNSEAQVLAEAGSEDLLTAQFIADKQLKSVTDGIFDSFAIISESDHIYGQVQIGIDISKHTPQSVNEYLSDDFFLVATVCDNAKEKCPLFLSVSSVIHKSFSDPANAAGSYSEIISQYCRVRDDLEDYIKGDFC